VFISHYPYIYKGEKPIILPEPDIPIMMIKDAKNSIDKNSKK
jgi:hypothetical protein